MFCPRALTYMLITYFRLTQIPKFQFCIEPHQIKKGLLDSVLQDVYYPGFPTLKHIPHVVSTLYFHIRKYALFGGQEVK